MMKVIRITRRTNLSRRKRVAEIFRRKHRRRLLSKRRRVLRDTEGFAPTVPLPATPTIPGFLPKKTEATMLRGEVMATAKTSKRVNRKHQTWTGKIASMFGKMFSHRGQLR